MFHENETIFQLYKRAVMKGLFISNFLFQNQSCYIFHDCKLSTSPEKTPRGLRFLGSSLTCWYCVGAFFSSCNLTGDDKTKCSFVRVSVCVWMGVCLCEDGCVCVCCYWDSDRTISSIFTNLCTYTVWRKISIYCKVKSHDWDGVFMLK